MFMSRIKQKFEELKQSGGKALVAFVTAGDPDINELPNILKALEEAGADLVEVGIPFSDPIADGPTIQASSQRALDKGVKVSQIFDAVKESVLSIPVIYMGYTNIAMRMGLERFAGLVKDSGADGVLLSDLTPEEAGEWKECADIAELDTVFLVAPTSTDERIRLACEMASGFVYCVSRTGVTGAESAVPTEVSELVRRVKERTELPICVGFGISKPDQVRMVCSIADGAVVGSYFVNFLHERWHSGGGRDEFVRAVKELKDATR